MINKLADLKRQIGEVIITGSCNEKPVTLQYREYLDDPIFQITIKSFESNTFIDKNGCEWKKKV